MQIQNAPQTISYLHNALGQRQQKTVNGVITYFVYDLNGQLIAELNSASNEFTDYLYLEGKPLAMAKPTPAAPVEPVQGATIPWPVSILFVLGGFILTVLRKPLPMIQRYTKALRRTAVVMLLSGLGLSCQQTPVVNIPYDLFYFHTDHLGTVKLVTDKTAAVVWEGIYSPFGDVKEVVAEIENNLRFPGQYLDRETGLHYNYFRTYDPKTGRYLESDPIGLDGGISTYGYAYQNPVNYSDPDGLIPIDVATDAVVIIGDIVIGVQTGDWGPLAIDAPMAMIPYAPAGAGLACKLVGKSDDVVDLANAQRRRHILDGDATGGGHRPGTGIPGKSEFPQGWSDDKIMHEISDIATDPNSVTRAGRGGRTITEGTRDGVNIRVVQEKNGDIVTGFPTNTPRNP